jgi:hypothetical protein
VHVKKVKDALRALIFLPLTVSIGIGNHSPMNTPTPSAARQPILEELGSITQMRRGTLSERYVVRPAPNGGTVSFGPYFKFQIWQDGRNQTRSVTADEAPLLREDIANFHRFEQLCQQLAQLNIEHTLALRGTEAAAAHAITEKKTSKPNASPKNTAKRNTSSPKPAKSSPTGKNSKA